MAVGPGETGEDQLFLRMYPNVGSRNGGGMTSVVGALAMISSVSESNFRCFGERVGNIGDSGI